MPKNCYGFLVLFFIELLSAPACKADWSSSQVYEPWLNATGHAFNPSTEAAILEHGTISFVDQEGNDLGKSFWFETDRINIDPVIESNGMTASGSEFRHYQSVYISSGFTVSEDRHHHFIVAVLEQRVETHDGDGNKVAVASASVVPLKYMGGEDECISYMDDARSSMEKDPPHLECYNPDWIGNGGVQCCGYLLALGEGMRSCSSRYWVLVSACLPASLAIGGGVFKWCASHCAVAPPLIAACLKSCLVMGGISSVGSLVACLAGAQMAYEECCAEKKSQYWRDLAGSGCKMVSPENAPDSRQGGS